MNIEEKTMRFCMENKKNAMLIGRHGVGKSSMIEALFQEHYGPMNENWLYFSGATLDPWVDFVGTPKEVKGADGKTHLQMITPIWHGKPIKAIFIDEFNRSHKKVRNAIMELIQFKRINGQEFPELEVVWAAINPYDDEETYAVEKPDPAQMDRFHYHIELPYKPDMVYFKKAHGVNAEPAIEWWEELGETLQNKISPRRLDYALEIHAQNGNLRYVLPENCNVAKLVNQLHSTPHRKTLKDIFDSKDLKKAEKFLAEENQFSGCKDQILKNPEYTEFYIPVMEKEKMISLLSAKDNAKTYPHLVPTFKALAKKEKNVMEALTEMNTAKILTNEIRRQLDDLWGAPDANKIRCHISPKMKGKFEEALKKSGNGNLTTWSNAVSSSGTTTGTASATTATAKKGTATVTSK